MGYRYAGDFLAQAGSAFDVQKKNMGVLELVIDQLPGMGGAQEILTLSLQQFEIPGREVGTGDLHFLNGVVKYPTKPNPQGPISVTFRDFPRAKTRAKLVQWFNLVYDEESGLMLPPGALKATGFLVLFQSDATSERTARLEGLFPTKLPTTTIDFSGGEHIEMQMDLSCDRVVWEQSLFNTP